MKQLTLFFSLLLSVCLLNSCASDPSTENKSSESAEPVQVKLPEPQREPSMKKADLTLLKVTKSSQSKTFTISGRVIPQNTTQLSAEVQGMITKDGISFKAGNTFKKGDVLVQINKKEFELALEAQRSAFLNALTQMMPDMKSDFPDNYQNWLQYIEQYQFGESLPPLPKTLSEKEKYFVTTYQIYNQYYSIKSQEERLKKFTIQAPYSGIVTQANIDLGSLVAPGQPIGTIINRYSYELEAGVDLKTAKAIRIGDRVTFTSNEIDGEWKGKVIRKNNIIDPSTQNIPIYFRLSGKDIRSGMYLEGNYTLPNLLDNVAVLPTKAVKRDGTVLLLVDDVIRSQSVEIVDYLTESIVVKGLKEGDNVILDDFKLPVAGKKVAM